MNDSAIDNAIRTARILVVDDIEANVEMTTGLLEVAGYNNVQGTTDSHHALAMAESDAFDLILLDMRMPVLDGMEFIRRLRLRDVRRLPAIIVVTAQTDEDTRRAALEGGARDFIVKPFKFWELQHRVRNALEIQVLYRQTRDSAFQHSRDASAA